MMNWWLAARNATTIWAMLWRHGMIAPLGPIPRLPTDMYLRASAGIASRNDNSRDDSSPCASPVECRVRLPGGYTDRCSRSRCTGPPWTLA